MSAAATAELDELRREERVWQALAVDEPSDEYRAQYAAARAAREEAERG